MRALVTLGPTYEPFDQVRRLTNFSTGQLGTDLANFLVERGHEVTALGGYYTTYRNVCRAQNVLEFTTAEDLLEKLQLAAKQSFDDVFHAAAVSDFAFGTIFRRLENGHLEPIRSGKYSTRCGALLAELVPTPKIIAHLRPLFPASNLVGWKFEVEGDRLSALAAGQAQLAENHTNYCVVNGPAYGSGFGIIAKSAEPEHCTTAQLLFEALLRRCIFDTSLPQKS